MKKLLLIAVLGFTLGTASTAHATTFSLGSFDVTLRSTDPGLVLWSADLFNPADPSLNPFTLDSVGDSFTTNLFRVGTKETALNLDDVVPYPITVDFAFNSPAPGFGGTAQGITGAAWVLNSIGYVAWDNPLVLQFGQGGLLGVTLSNVAFGLPGSADVSATFKLLRQDVRSVPELPAVAMTFIGLASLLVTLRRRSRVA